MNKTTEDFIASIMDMEELPAITAAEETGWIVRIADRDGQATVMTLDYRTDRLNLKIKDGKVIAVDVG
jgi:hypothetical protein